MHLVPFDQSVLCVDLWRSFTVQKITAATVSLTSVSTCVRQLYRTWLKSFLYWPWSLSSIFSPFSPSYTLHSSGKKSCQDCSVEKIKLFFQGLIQWREKKRVLVCFSIGKRKYKIIHLMIKHKRNKAYSQNIWFVFDLKNGNSTKIHRKLLYPPPQKMLKMQSVITKVRCGVEYKLIFFTLFMAVDYSTLQYSEIPFSAQQY